MRRETERFDGPTDTGSESAVFVFESYTQYLAEVYFAPQASVKAVDVHEFAFREMEQSSPFRDAMEATGIDFVVLEDAP